LHNFMARKCELVDAANPCRCALRVDYADAAAREVVREMEQLHSAADLLRGHPDYAAPGTTTEIIRGLLDRALPLRVLQR
jgi:hypothetical protein